MNVFWEVIVLVLEIVLEIEIAIDLLQVFQAPLIYFIEWENVRLLLEYEYDVLHNYSPIIL